MNKRTYSIGFLLLTLSLLPAISHSESQEEASVQVMILDDAGAFAENTKLYIYSKETKAFSEVTDQVATSAMALDPGHYRMYAAQARLTSGIVEHFVSPEANISILPGEHASVILALERVVDHEMVVSDSVLEKISIDPELAKYIN